VGSAQDFLHPLGLFGQDDLFCFPIPDVGGVLVDGIIAHSGRSRALPLGRKDGEIVVILVIEAGPVQQLPADFQPSSPELL